VSHPPRVFWSSERAYPDLTFIPTMCYDNLLKYWAEKYAQQMASWAFRQPITTPVEILKTELSVEPIRADSVIFLKSGPEIQHLEFQTRVPQNRPMPIRMCSYSIRLQWEYELPVRQVLIWLVPTSNPAVFETEFRTEFTHHRYQVILYWRIMPYCHWRCYAPPRTPRNS
jgi:predicted transposase YdaD